MRVLPLLTLAACMAATSAERPRPDSSAKPANPAKPTQPITGPAKSSVKKAAAPAARPAERRREESGRTPSVASRPDTAFARASEWESGESEILAYAVKRIGPDGERQRSGRMITQRLFLRPDGVVTEAPETAAGSPKETEILNAALLEGGGEDIPFSTETVCQFNRLGDFNLLRQEQSLMGRTGTTHRSLDCRMQPPRLRIASSGGEAARDTILTRWPVYTEAMLFTYLRAIPLRQGYREEVWLQDWGREGSFDLVPRFASITVAAHAPGVRDTDTWYVTVDRDDGRQSRFWVGASGLHPIIVADLSDGTEWVLQGISRKKLPGW
jgi:hypothetical protein